MDYGYEDDEVVVNREVVVENGDYDGNKTN